MTHIEKQHLDAIEESQDWIVNEIVWGIKEKIAAKKSAEITENISIEFAEWITSKYFLQYAGKLWASDLPIYSGCSYSTKELFQEYLKSKENDATTKPNH